MKKLKFLSVVSLIMAAALTACSPTSPVSSSQVNTNTHASDTSAYDTLMRVSYIDVGQGDSEFIELPNGKTMLIDAGPNEAGSKVVEYIKSLGYTSIDYVVATHPHEDHIGGMDDVINAFDIGDIYMPKVSADTKTYEDLLDAISAKNLIIYTAHAGVSVIGDDGLSVNMLAPVSDSYDDLNNYSAVIRIVYGDTSFLFTGDAENISESEITDDVKADVLKVGHHGSDTSTSDDFLAKVNPSIAVISCGKDNKYGHPTESTVQKLKDKGVQVLRTDEVGTIVISTDGSNLKMEQPAGELK
ncbi:hypothetical protein SDC9_71827 [bioreactor metagenome]|uniref:Metallo-beta-lactamase domain-containing protein n=1 Tax=bioreactor metagenome TaxID=1076179 RepID=A0A644Y9U6_9ZZZZ|nr:MBL fold metallo-hydrolase [Candidatus Metalachnospira sp.]